MEMALKIYLFWSSTRSQTPGLQKTTVKRYTSHDWGDQETCEDTGTRACLNRHALQSSQPSHCHHCLPTLGPPVVSDVLTQLQPRLISCLRNMQRFWGGRVSTEPGHTLAEPTLSSNNRSAHIHPKCLMTTLC